MEHSDDILGKEKIWKLVYKMAVPCILAQIINLLYNLVDRIYIGNMEGIGNDCLAGLGLCIPIITLLMAFSGFVAGGGTPLAGRYLGEGKREKAEKILGNGAFLLVFFSVVLTIIVFIFKERLLYLIGASENTFKYANDYLTIYLMGTLFVQITMGLNNFIVCQGKSKIAMLSTMIGAVLNIALDPLFIFVFKLNVKGAAIATVISQAVSAIFILAVLFNKKTSLRLKFNMMAPDIRIIGSIMSLGVAQFVMTATESVIGFALNGQLKKYGGDIHVSNLTVLQSAMMLISTPIQGFTQGVLPIISYNYGSCDKVRLKEAFKDSLIVTFLYASVLAIMMIVFPYPFVRIFTSDPELIKLGMKYLPIFVSGMLIFGSQRACQTTFVATGQAVISLSIAIIRKIILLVPFSFIFPLFMDVTGVYVAECVADLMSATICMTIFILRFKKILSSMDERRLKLSEI